MTETRRRRRRGFKKKTREAQCLPATGKSGQTEKQTKKPNARRRIPRKRRRNPATTGTLIRHTNQILPRLGSAPRCSASRCAEYSASETEGVPHAAVVTAAITAAGAINELGAEIGADDSETQPSKIAREMFEIQDQLVAAAAKRMQEHEETLKFAREELARISPHLARQPVYAWYFAMDLDRMSTPGPCFSRSIPEMCEDTREAASKHSSTFTRRVCVCVYTSVTSVFSPPPLVSSVFRHDIPRCL